jgi:tetratricopeptide (TPR) repeat protein
VSARKRRAGAGAGAASGGDAADETAVDRIMTALERWPAGLHDLGEPTVDVPIDWPATVSDVYLAFDGGTLFGDLLTLAPAAQAPAADEDGLVAIGELMGDGLWFDRKGRVWRADPDTGDRIVDGSRFDRWLHGVIDGLAALYDDDGEFAEEAFTDDGELTDEVALAMLHAQLKRDSRAPGPRWRLARALTAQGELAAAREQLEDVVANSPELAWAWLDLARISERLGELTGAIDEAEAAAGAGTEHELAGYFLAEAARLAAKAGDEPRRADVAARALARDPSLARDRLAAATTSLEAGELDDAAHLVALARALAPRDLAALDLARRIDAAREQSVS